MNKKILYVILAMLILLTSCNSNTAENATESITTKSEVKTEESAAKTEEPETTPTTEPTKSDEETKKQIDELLKGTWSFGLTDNNGNVTTAIFTFDNGTFTGTVLKNGSVNQESEGEYQIQDDIIKLKHNTGNEGELSYILDGSNFTLFTGNQELKKGDVDMDLFTEKTNNSWKFGYYSDNFDNPTDEAFIINEDIKGSFSNSATNNSDLSVWIIVDEEYASITLFEYDRTQVKNTGRYDDEYGIQILANDVVHEFYGYIYGEGGDRIVLEGEERNQLIELLESNDEITFYIQNIERPTSEYKFTCQSGNFSEEYGKLN